MKRLAFNLYTLTVVLAAMLGGLLGSAGVAVAIWGPQILDTALADPPDRSHPAFWLWILLLVPSMLLGLAGAISLLILPVAFRFPEAASVSPRQTYQLHFLRRYAEKILGYVAAEEKRHSTLTEVNSNHKYDA